MKSWGGLLIVLLLVATGECQEAPNPQVPARDPFDPRDSVGWALAEAAQIPAEDRVFWRWIVIPPFGDASWQYAVNFAVNTISRAGVLKYPRVSANGWLLGYDLRELSPKDPESLIQVWDSMAINEPYFHVLSASNEVGQPVLSPHLLQDQAVTLEGATLSAGAIYRADWFLKMSLTQVDNGRYYELSGIREVPIERVATDGKTEDSGGTAAKTSQPPAKPRLSELTRYLESRGLYYEKTVSIAGEQRSAVLRSRVTGRQRIVIYLTGVGRSKATVTLDQADRGFAKADQQPLLNLLNYEPDALELLVTKENGLIEYSIANVDGELQDSVPDTIASDHSLVGAGAGNLRLQPAISCIRCHGVPSFGVVDQESAGYQPFGNDVRRLLESGRFEFVDDVSVLGQKLTSHEAKDRLERLYSGLLDEGGDSPVARLRRDYETAVRRLTKQQMSVADLSKLVSDIITDYDYALITPGVACSELGIQVDGGGGNAAFNKMIGDLPPGARESPYIAFLKAGVSVGRREWELIYPDVAYRRYSQAIPDETAEDSVSSGSAREEQ